MEKLNKVIAGLECCLDEDRSCRDSCPYFKGAYELDGCMDDMLRDALEVLRSGSGDLISRSKFLESIEGTDWYTVRYNGEVSQGAPSEEVAWYKATDIYAAIENAPAVEAEPVVHAHWEESEYRGFLRCSACKDCYIEEEWIENAKWNGCPNCRAKMDEEVAE